jgi:hypothetical protein
MTHVMGSRLALLVAALLSVAAAPPPDGADVRQDLESLERTLDGAVRQVSRASAPHVLAGGDSCRSYILKGYGAFFVLSPRLLPTRRMLRLNAPFQITDQGLDRIVKAMEDDLRRAQTAELRVHIQGQIDAVKRIQARFRAQMQQERMPPPPPAQPRSPEARSPSTAPGAPPDIRAQIQQMEQQAEEMAWEAERLRQEGERRIEEMTGGSDTRVVSAGPADPGSPAAAGPPVMARRFWIETEEDAARPPELVIRDVRTAVTNALEARGADLRHVRPEESVVVAVDFYPHGAFGPREEPEHTLVVRVKKSDLLERRAGKLSPEELRQRIEYVEY